MMGSEPVIDTLNTGHRQKIPAHVCDWLQSSTRSYYGSGKQQPWSQPQYKAKVDRTDVDQHSVVSPDDSVSVTDSNHESCSSDSSAHTYSTNATDPNDFLDEDDRDSVRSKDWYKGIAQGRFRSETSKEEYIRKLHEHMVRQAKTGHLEASTPKRTISVSRCPPPVPQSHRSASVERSERCSDNRSQSIPRSQISEPQLQKCNRRRSSCSTKGQSPPCKLTRDTECTDHFVTLLIVFATRLITAFWPLSACPPMMTTCFNGAGVLPLKVFIQETLKRSRASYSTLQVALFYLVLLKARLPAGVLEQSRNAHGESRERECRALQCGRRMFLSALMLASKYLQDRNYSARAWSKISGLRSNEINENERDYLYLIDYNLHIPKESFDNWSKIVIALSRLSNKAPQCRADFSDLDAGNSGSGPGNSLADMVPSLHLDEAEDQALFSDDWWTDVIQKLDPQMVKDKTLTQSFLKNFVPGYRDLSTDPEKASDNADESTTELDSLSSVLDINLSESLRSRTTETPKLETPQTPVQMSPFRASAMPRQPQLRNLPTPQSTPPIADGHHSSTPGSRPSLRCSASVDALRSMRRQCMMNANLDRCPPPRSQPFALPMRSWTRPAETIQEYPSRSTTPSVSSPASVASDMSSCTSRSRSSSISSNSSWSTVSSTLPRIRAAGAGQFSSPLAHIWTPSNRLGTFPSREKCDSSATSLHDEGYGSSEEPLPKRSDNSSPSGLEANAVRILLSLSSQLDTSSQSATPTPQNYDAPSKEALSQIPRGHKRTLSNSECVQSYVRYLLRGESGARGTPEVVDDPMRPCLDATPRQRQEGTKFWAAPRMAMPNRNDSKRMALHCASAPDLASQYLRQHVSMTAS